MESPVAQWLEHLTRSRRVVGSNPIWDSDFFSELSINSISSPILPQNKRRGALEMARIENGSDVNASFTSEWLASIGYELNSSSGVGNVLKRMVYYVKRRVTAETNGEKRKRFRNQ